MASAKRKNGETNLHRRVRARRESCEEIVGSFLDVENEPGRKDPTIITSEAEFKSQRRTNDYSDGTSLTSSESESEQPVSISFGALAKAEETLGSSAKKKPAYVNNNDDVWEDHETQERKAGRADVRDFSRASKHAPVMLSSKKAVSRKRDIIPVIRPEYRDPRFESLSGRIDNSRLQKAYSFLDDYREDEMKDLKAAIKKAKDGPERENMKRTLLSMESRKKDQERRRKEAEILDKHMKQEKELVKQGKKPFYLKKAEQKKRLLVERYHELKGKQLDHVLERRRKKAEGKEKKKLPWSRRDVK